MRVLVSDASILIELAKWSLLEALFQLPFEFAVPDALFADELIDLGEVDRDRLTAPGLRVESLDAEGMMRAVAYQTARPKLTIHDCLAVTLAVINDWPLLTGDKRMRTLADEEDVEVHGVLFLELLDRDVYGDISSLEEAMARHEAPFYLRRIKEALVTFPETGHVKALFTRRNVHLGIPDLRGGAGLLRPTDTLR